MNPLKTKDIWSVAALILRMRRFPWSTGDLPAVVLEEACVVLVSLWILMFLVAAVWHWRGRPAGIPSTWVALSELQVEGWNFSLEWILRSGARSSPDVLLSKDSSIWCRISAVLKWVKQTTVIASVLSYCTRLCSGSAAGSLFSVCVCFKAGFKKEGFLLLRVLCVWTVSLIWIPALLCQVKTPGVQFYILSCFRWGSIKAQTFL